MRSIVLGVAAVLLISVGARADDAPASPSEARPCLVGAKPADPKVMDAAGQVLTISGAKQRMTMIFDTLIPALLEEEKKGHPDIDDKTLGAFSTALRDELTSHIPFLLSGTACIYANHFTADELNGLVAFYNSPIGKRLIAETPAISKEAFAFGMEAGKRYGAEAVQDALRKLRSEGVKI
jgi:hypothetical protein